jgi:hypothetical protein
MVDADGDGQHQGVVLAGDGHAVAVADPEPALGDVGHRDAAPGDLVLVVEDVALDLQVAATSRSTVNRSRTGVTKAFLTVATLSPTLKIRSPRSFSIQKSSPRLSSFSRSRYRVPAGAPSGGSSRRDRRLIIDPLPCWPATVPPGRVLPHHPLGVIHPVA